VDNHTYIYDNCNNPIYADNDHSDEEYDNQGDKDSDNAIDNDTDKDSDIPIHEDSENSIYEDIDENIDNQSDDDNNGFYTHGHKMDDITIINDFNLDGYVRQPLYNGTDLTTCAAICSILQFALCNNLTNEAIEKLLKLLNLFTSPNCLTRSFSN